MTGDAFADFLLVLFGGAALGLLFVHFDIRYERRRSYRRLHDTQGLFAEGRDVSPAPSLKDEEPPCQAAQEKPNA